MGTLTKRNALLGEIEPYSPNPLTLEKAMADAGVEDADGEYTPSDKKTIAIAAIKVLRKFLSLSSDSLGKSSQGYSVEGLQKRIKALCQENGLDVEEYVDDLPTIEDGSKYW